MLSRKRWSWNCTDAPSRCSCCTRSRAEIGCGKSFRRIERHSPGEFPATFRALGAYSTPLALYNALAQRPDDLHVIDDCAGLFGNPIAMAVLKAAAWTSVGSGGERRMAWGSTSEKVAQPEFVFRGKLILLTNIVPAGKETEAFLSRTLHLKLEFSAFEMRALFMRAAADTRYFGDQERAQSVAEFLAEQIGSTRRHCMSLRTLQLGYDLMSSWVRTCSTVLPFAHPGGL